MRKIACLILLLADIALSCEVVAMSSHDYPIVEINLFDENKVDMGKVKSVDYGNGLLKEEKTFLAYRADLDTSVYVYLDGKQMKFYKMCHSAQECDSLYEDYDFAKVISDEMHKMGSRGLFVRKFDADSLSRHILDVMLSESYNDFTLSGISYNYDRSYSDEDDHDADVAAEALTAGMFCEGFCDFMDTLSQCPELVTASIPETRLLNRVTIHKISGNAYLVEKDWRNELYRMYGLNGALLDQGYAYNGILWVRQTPVILEISNQRFLLK